MAAAAPAQTWEPRNSSGSTTRVAGVNIFGSSSTFLPDESEVEQLRYKLIFV